MNLLYLYVAQQPNRMSGKERTVAVITTRRLNPDTWKYHSQEDAKALEVEGKFGYQRRPPLCYEYQEDSRLTLIPLLEDGDKINNPDTIEQKISKLFPHENVCGLFKEAILYIHGFNCSPQQARSDADIIYGITGKPTIVFDWASTHSYRFFGGALYCCKRVC